MKLLCCIYYIPLCSTLFRWNTCVVDIQEEKVQVQAFSVDYVKLGAHEVGVESVYMIF